MICPVTH